MIIWPITTAEAARLLDLHPPTATTIVRALHIPIRRLGSAKCLDEASFRLLEEAARPFQSKRRQKNKELAETGS